jgi:hypothetical protein
VASPTPPPPTPDPPTPDPPTPSPNPTPNGTPSLVGWKKRLVAAGSAVALAFIGGASGTGLTYLIAGRQEVGAEQAVEENKRRQDAAVSPVKIESASFSGGLSVASSELLDLDNDRLVDRDEIIQKSDGSALAVRGARRGRWRT